MPVGLGTHGAPLQQSALDAQPAPASAHWALAQRGTPSLSCLHVSIVSQLPAQQSHVELHDIVWSLQTAPFGSQLRPARLQMPTVAGGVIAHCTNLPFDEGALGTPMPPQQSWSFVQRSPIVWQPVAGWQTSTPVGPHGAQLRLQHPPPHWGTPLSKKTTPPSPALPPQRTPSGIWQLAEPLGGGPHVPSVCPDATLQVPVQQSLAVWQASPCCTQNEEAWQVPPLQYPEQQSPATAQALPSVLQPGLSVAHAPLVHVPLQHWAFAVHAALSAAHAGKAQAPLLHTLLQHAPFVLHALPSDAHPPSVPNGLPASPMFTPPLLLPLPPLLPPPPLLPLLPAPLLLPPLLLVPLLPLLPPLPSRPRLPLLLPFDVASPPPSWFTSELVVPPQAANEPPQTGATRTATHKTRPVRRRSMRRTAAGVVPSDEMYGLPFAVAPSSPNGCGQ
jgi:hypothetical protein